METDDFWLVNIGQGIGPLLLGASRQQGLEALRASGVQTKADSFGRESPLRIANLGIWLVFADDGSQTIRRIEITNPRVRFATWDVIGKPIHKAIRLFRCADSETLWCNSYDESAQRDLELSATNRTELKVFDDIALLRSGTLWIPTLGLGFTLKEGLINRLHVCKPEHVPKIGVGTWNVAQKTMSELGKLPRHRLARGVEPSSRTKLARTILTLSLFAVLGLIAWRSVELQLRWNALPDIPARVIAITPPPPAPFGDRFQLRYLDEMERTHEITMERMDFFDEPKLNSIVNIRYLPGSPDAALGDRRHVDVGMNYGLPKVFVVVAVYSALLLLFEILRWFRTRFA